MPKRPTPSAAWKKGQSGNPDGRARVKVITDMIRLIANEEITEKDNDGNVRIIKRLRKSTEALFDEAAKGNVAAYSVIAERLDGKVPNVQMNVETPLDGADTSALAALQDALEGLTAERDPEAAGGDEGETVH